MEAKLQAAWSQDRTLSSSRAGLLWGYSSSAPLDSADSLCQLVVKGDQVVGSGRVLTKCGDQHAGGGHVPGRAVAVHLACVGSVDADARGPAVAAAHGWSAWSSR